MEIPGPPADARFASVKVVGVGKNVCYCFLIVLSYCCKISEGKDISCAKHCNAVTRPYIRCVVALDDIRSLRDSDKRQLRQTMLAR